MSEAWVDRARAALDGKDEPSVDLVPVHRPPIVDRGLATALATLLLGAACLGIAVWRELETGNPFDRLAMPLRFVAVVALLRGLVGAAPLLGRLRLSRARTRYGVAVCDEGLVVRTPDGERVVARDEVAGVVEPGDWGKRASVRRFVSVYLLVEPDTAGRALVELPPIFEDTPGILAERLMRWRGPAEPRPPVEPAAKRLASVVYDDAARGKPAAGVAVVHHGSGWLRRGPYAALLFALVFAEAALRLPAEVSLGALPVVALAVCVAIPLTWIGLTWRHVAPRKGLALVLTPTEALLRTRAGVLRAAWTDVPSMSVESVTGWSLLEGRSETRKLRLDRVDAPPIRYDEAFLGVPAEVALALAEAYRKRTLGGR